MRATLNPLPAHHPAHGIVRTLDQQQMPDAAGTVTTPLTAPSAGSDAHLMSYTHPPAVATEVRATQEPKPGKRKRAAVQPAIQQDEEPQLNTQHAAEELAQLLHHTVGDGDGAGRQLAPAQVQYLSSLLLSARSQGLLAALHPGTLQSLLRALHVSMRAALHGEAPHHQRTVAMRRALEAVVVALLVLSTPELPPEVYMEEVLQCSIAAVQQGLVDHVLASMDSRWRKTTKADPDLPDEEEDVGPAPKKARGGKAARKTAQATGSTPASELLPVLEQATALLSDVLTVIKVDPGAVLPLIRTLLGSITVAGLPTVFKVKAVGLVVTFFHHTPDHWVTVLQEVLAPAGLLGCSTTGTTKGPPRDFTVRDTPPVRIQISSALILQLVQAAAELPPADASPDQVHEACKAPSQFCDRFWLALIDQLPNARAAKSEGSCDLKAFMEQLLLDLVAVQHLPEWPAALLMLRRMALALNTGKGLQHPDNNVRLVCIELLGQVVASIVADKKQAELDRHVVDQVLASLPTNYLRDAYQGDEERGQEEALQRLLQGHLAAAAPSLVRSSARRLWALKMLGQRLEWEQRMALPACGSQPDTLAPATDAVTGQAGGKKEKGRKKDKAARIAEPAPVPPCAPSSSTLAVSYRSMCAAPAAELMPVMTLEDDTRGGQPLTLGPTTGLPAALCATISQWLLHNSALGKGVGNLLLRLLETGSRIKDAASGLASAAGLRCRAVRALGAAMEADERLLHLPEVTKGVEAALLDEAVSVREAALELLGKHIARSADLAVAYFEIISRASQDQGVSVRKRAVKVLWDCCVHCPSFPLVTQAVALILQRAADQEESVRKLAMQLCGGLWFSSAGLAAGTELDADGAVSTGQLLYSSGAAMAASSSRGPAARAQQLAEVCGAVYASEGSVIHLPLAPDHPLVVMLQSILLGGPPGQVQSAAATTTAALAARDASRAGACEVAAALVKRVLELGDAAAAAEGAAAAQAEEHGFVPHDRQQGGSVNRGTMGARMADGDEVESAPAAARQRTGAQHEATHGLTQTADVGGAGGHAGVRPLAEIEVEQFNSLLALHALCVADVAVVVPAGTSPTQFVSSLHTLLKFSPPRPQEPRERVRAAAERLLAACHCVEAVVSRGMCGRALEARILKEITDDITAVITRHQFLVVVEGAVQCLCTLACTHPSGPHSPVAVVVRLATNCYRHLEKDASEDPSVAAAATPAKLANHSKLLFMLGQLCRFGCPLMDQPAGSQQWLAAPLATQAPALSSLSNATSVTPTPSTGPATTPAAAPTSAQCLRVFATYFTRKFGGQSGPQLLKVKETALQAMGLLFVARPHLMSDCRSLLKQQLQPGSPVAFKQRTLAILTDVLRAEEDLLKARQQATETASVGAGGSVVSVTLTSSTRPAASPMAPAPSGSLVGGTGLARRNGEGDMSVAGSEVQQLLAPALALATEVGLDLQGGTGPAEGLDEAQLTGMLQAGAVVRRRVLDLVEVVHRAGMTAPWIPVPALVALTCDFMSPSTAQKALRVLKLCCASHEEHVSSKLVEGLALAADFIARLHRADSVHAAQGKAAHALHELPAEVVTQLGELWSLVVSPSRSLKTRFLSSLLQPLANAATMPTSGPLAASLDVGVMAFNCCLAAALPYRRGDEPLALMACINQTVSRRGNNVLDELKRHTEQQPQQPAPQQQTELAATSTAVTPAATPGPQQAISTAATPATTAAAPAVHSTAAYPTSSAPTTPAATLGATVTTATTGLKLPATTSMRRGPAMVHVAPHVAAAKASLALCLLLVLKKYLREAYRLTDERVAAYNPQDASARGQEEKTPVAKDGSIQMMLQVVSLGAVSAPAGSRALKELYKATKFLLDNDAANYRAAEAAAEAAAEEGEDGEQAAVKGKGGKSASKGRKTPASKVGAKSTPRMQGKGGAKASTAKKRKRRADSEDDTEDEVEEEGGRSRGRPSTAGKGRRVQSRLMADSEGEEEGDDDEPMGRKRPGGSRGRSVGGRRKQAAFDD